MKMIIDASNMIAGRLATRVAKQAMLGVKIDIVNCEKVVITGNKLHIFSEFKRRVDMGIPLRGPYYPRQPDRILRRIIRGMLPFQQSKGREAFKRVMCWKGIPSQFKNEKFENFESVKNINVSKLPNVKYVYLGDIAKFLGGKVE